jgi:hypothetical protein
MITFKKRRKYKYNLQTEYRYQTNIVVDKPVDLGKLEITNDGHLTIREGYAWDGPSGPTIDTKNFMRGSLIHDALYQLMRSTIIDQGQRKRADEILKEICIDAGMSKIRAWWVYLGVRWLGSGSSQPDTLQAP